MPNIRAILFAFLVYITFTAALTDAASFGLRASAEDIAGAEDVDSNVNQDKDRATFSNLLSAVSPQALDQLLHQYAPGTFKNGVSGPDRKSAEAISARAPELPSSIVRMAIRQATSGNDTSTSDTTTSPTSTTSDTLSTTSTTSTDEPTTSTEQTPTETISTSQDTPTSPSSTPEATPTPTSTSTSIPTSTSTTEITETTEPVETTRTTETSGPTSSSSLQTPESSSDTDFSTSK
ncbi:hypothetical protein F5B22DRAFT_357191 [Xylaria bambusicola]|uniref:uncharacterized protein n=1 Tax=Xylaria bambusicola TaxID=326684 RepID=UPI00200778DE|nr:uncharacterized protein F5B22DRAFT_357191 [Xylaria bambusicola]KAI0525714.1 hypothetical protein F5B22DRAFT_357191 [Xylaria bambusicola]